MPNSEGFFSSLLVAAEFAKRKVRHLLGDVGGVAVTWVRQPFPAVWSAIDPTPPGRVTLPININGLARFDEKRERVEVFLLADLSPSQVADVTAHELKHAQQFLSGQARYQGMRRDEFERAYDANEVAASEFGHQIGHALRHEARVLEGSPMAQTFEREETKNMRADLALGGRSASELYRILNPRQDR